MMIHILIICMSITVATSSVSLTGPSFVDEGDPIRLICTATADEGQYPPTDVDWFKDSSKLTMDVDYRVSIVKHMFRANRTLHSRLEIAKAQKEDTGIYICRTSNLELKSLKVSVLTAVLHRVEGGGDFGRDYEPREQASGTSSSFDSPGLLGRLLQCLFPLAFMRLV